MVPTEVLMSAAAETRRRRQHRTRAVHEEKAFWQAMMDRYGSEEKYNKQLINAFKHGEDA